VSVLEDPGSIPGTSTKAKDPRKARGFFAVKIYLLRLCSCNVEPSLEA
jgi:hypothetical protein